MMAIFIGMGFRLNLNILDNKYLSSRLQHLKERFEFPNVKSEAAGFRDNHWSLIQFL
jgi:hypothetical protein